MTERKFVQPKMSRMCLFFVVTATIPLAADVGAEDAGGEKHQQHPDGRAPVIDGCHHSYGTRSGASHRPTAVLAAGAIALRWTDEPR